MKNKTDISRRDFMGSAVAATAVLSLVAGVGKASARPNVIYLFSDEHRYQSMSFTGMPALRTTNMAQIAREGTSFENMPHAEFADPPEDKKAFYSSPDQLPWRVNTDESKRKAWRKTTKDTTRISPLSTRKLAGSSRPWKNWALPKTPPLFIMRIARENVVADLANDHTPFFHGVRGKHFTYMAKMDDPWQLFDNEADFCRMENLIDDPAYAGKRAQFENLKPSKNKK